MISSCREGAYKLIETKHHIKVLYLDNISYAWVATQPQAELLLTSHHIHKTDCLLCMGAYKMYAVKDEPALSDQLHLELQVFQRKWQGYLLDSLPALPKQRCRIIPTQEIITGKTKYARAIIDGAGC